MPLRLLAAYLRVKSYILTVGIKFSFGKCQPEIFGLKSATLNLKWRF